MRRAVALARRGAGRVEPNPMVGCVIVNGGRIVGEGFHRRYGSDHAEVAALRHCPPAAAKGATVFVTLEPCDHHGKTPPCTEALVAAGVAEVIVGLRDPHPRVSGRGLRRLRRAGIRVATGLLADEIRALNAPYLKRCTEGLPYVIAKWAQSIDGRIAPRGGDSQWISGPAARRWAHRLRGRVDAVIVGSQTVLTDDPALTCRDAPRRRIAQRVVLDTRLRTPPGAVLAVTAAQAPTTIFTAQHNLHTPRAEALARRGVRVMPARLRDGHVDPRDVLRRLAAEGMTNVLVEGGGEVLGAFFDRGLVDEAMIFVASRLIGGRGAVPAIAGRGPQDLDGCPEVVRSICSRVGGDVLHHLVLRRVGPVGAGRRRSSRPGRF